VYVTKKEPPNACDFGSKESRDEGVPARLTKKTVKEVGPTDGFVKKNKKTLPREQKSVHMRRVKGVLHRGFTKAKQKTFNCDAEEERDYPEASNMQGCVGEYRSKKYNN
jgi:hypothetical protein